jgi:hypothetical protein
MYYNRIKENNKGEMIMNRSMISGGGEIERNFRNVQIPKCECGRRSVIRKGKKCILCIKESRKEMKTQTKEK